MTRPVRRRLASLETGTGVTTETVTIILTDVSTASSAFITSPFAGTITKIVSVIDGVIATAPAVLTSEIGGTLITGSSISIADSGSGAGITDSATPTALNVLAVDDVLEVITSGASTNTVSATVTYTIALS